MQKVIGPAGFKPVNFEFLQTRGGVFFPFDQLGRKHTPTRVQHLKCGLKSATLYVFCRQGNTPFSVKTIYGLCCVSLWSRSECSGVSIPGNSFGFLFSIDSSLVRIYGSLSFVCTLPVDPPVSLLPNRLVAGPSRLYECLTGMVILVRSSLPHQPLSKAHSRGWFLSLLHRKVATSGHRTTMAQG